MSQIIRIQNKFFHIPSILNVRLQQTLFLKRPQLVLQSSENTFHRVNYGLSLNAWNQAFNDYQRAQASVTACQEALKQVPIFEQASTVVCS